SMIIFSHAPGASLPQGGFNVDGLSFCWLSGPAFGYAATRTACMSDDLMIEVANLTKRYAGHAAVSNISFSVRLGEIVGLLRPNGAGKSTTLRILSCYLPATAGTVRVAGLDVFEQSDE